jgi:CheY-like chemotaxis protein
MHVLVCEDDASVRLVLGRMLERLGCRVTEAEDGDDALAKYKKDPADVVLTDMVMPGMDGVETIRAFRKRHPEVRVVAMSGGAMAGAVLYLNLAIQLGAAAVLPKPFSVEELTRALGIPYLH